MASRVALFPVDAASRRWWASLFSGNEWKLLSAHADLRWTFLVSDPTLSGETTSLIVKVFGLRAAGAAAAAHLSDATKGSAYRGVDLALLVHETHEDNALFPVLAPEVYAFAQQARLNARIAEAIDAQAPLLAAAADVSLDAVPARDTAMAYLYVVERYVTGGSLAAALRATPAAVVRRDEWLHAFCLRAAWLLLALRTAKVTHGNISPSTIAFDRAPEGVDEYHVIDERGSPSSWMYRVRVGALYPGRLVLLDWYRARDEMKSKKTLRVQTLDDRAGDAGSSDRLPSEDRRVPDTAPLLYTPGYLYPKLASLWLLALRGNRIRRREAQDNWSSDAWALGVVVLSLMIDKSMRATGGEWKLPLVLHWYHDMVADGGDEVAQTRQRRIFEEVLRHTLPSERSERMTLLVAELAGALLLCRALGVRMELGVDGRYGHLSRAATESIFALDGGSYSNVARHCREQAGEAALSFVCLLLDTRNPVNGDVLLRHPYLCRDGTYMGTAAYDAATVSNTLDAGEVAALRGTPPTTGGK